VSYFRSIGVISSRQVTLSHADSVSPAEAVRNPPSAPLRFRPDIEGLRAVAVLAVVLFHAQVPGVGGGYVGVDVFFVISGFLITGLLWREASSTGTVRLRRFYGARARRLLPASAVVGIVTMICAAVLLPAVEVPSVLKDGIASALYLSNLRFIREGVDYFGGQLPTSPFQHYWSLSVEEQFYILWPPLILVTGWLLRRVHRGHRAEASSLQRSYVVALVLVTGASFALSLVVTYLQPAQAFYSLPTRAWQLALGGLLALTGLSWRRLSARAATTIGWAGLGMILLACTWLSATTYYPGFAALLPTLGAVLVIAAGCAQPAQGCGRALAVPAMQAIGRISYSWYLWHWPVLIFAPLLLGQPLGLGARVVAALLSAGLAWLTMRFLENPLRFSTKIRNSSLRSLGLGGVATAAAVGAGAALLISVPVPVGRGAPAAPAKFSAAPVAAGAPEAAFDKAVQYMFGQLQAAAAASLDLKAVPSNLDPALADAKAERAAMFANGCMRSMIEGGQPECAAGDTASSTTVALVGDSHAAMWNPAFQQIATQRHWRLLMMSKASCPLMALPSLNPLHRMVENTSHCEQWRNEILTRLNAELPELIVVSMWRGYDAARDKQIAYATYDQAWYDGLIRLVRQLRATGAKVLVLGPVPNPHFVVPVCLSGNLNEVASCTLSRSMSVNEAGIVGETAATQAGGGRYADLTNAFCTAVRCPVILGNTLVYLDWSHVTFEYSRLVSPLIGALADRALADG